MTYLLQLIDLGICETISLRQHIMKKYLILFCFIALSNVYVLSQIQSFGLSFKCGGNITFPIRNSNLYDNHTKIALRPGYHFGVNVSLKTKKKIWLYCGLEYVYSRYNYNFSFKFGSGGGVPSRVINKVGVHALLIPFGINMKISPMLVTEFGTSFVYSFPSPVNAIVIDPAGEERLLGRGLENEEEKYNLRLHFIQFYSLNSKKKNKIEDGIDLGIGASYLLFSDYIYLTHEKITKLSMILTCRVKIKSK